MEVLKKDCIRVGRNGGPSLHRCPSARVCAPRGLFQGIVSSPKCMLCVCVSTAGDEMVRHPPAVDALITALSVDLLTDDDVHVQLLQLRQLIGAAVYPIADRIEATRGKDMQVCVRVHLHVCSRMLHMCTPTQTGAHTRAHCAFPSPFFSLPFQFLQTHSPPLQAITKAHASTCFHVGAPPAVFQSAWQCHRTQHVPASPSKCVCHACARAERACEM